MNKKLHFLLFCLLLIIILCSCKDKLFNLIEPFSQVIITPDKAKLNPRETTFSILTYDTDLGSGVTQLSTCSDDSSWRMGEKMCRDYSLSGSNCQDIGDDGRLAFDACKVACDNCNTYTEVKRRLPSPVEEVDEPSYAQFEGSISDGSTGSDIGSADYREIISRLDDMKDSMGTLDRNVGAGVSAIQGESENMRIQLSSLTEGSELRDQLTRLDVDNDGFVYLDQIIGNMELDYRLSDIQVNISNQDQMRPLIDNIKSRLAQFTNTLIILCESLKKNNDLNADDKLLTTVDVENIQGIIEDLNTQDFNVVDNFNNRWELFMDQVAFNAVAPPPQNMPYNIAFLYLVEKYRVLNITSIKQQFTSSVNEINTKMIELIDILGQDADFTPEAAADSDADIQNKSNAALKLLEYSRGFNQFTEKVNKLSKLLLVELNRIQPPAVAADGGDIDARIAAARAAGRAAGRVEAEREDADEDAASAASAEKAEEEEALTAAEIGFGVGVVGVLGYFGARAAGLLD